MKSITLICLLTLILISCQVHRINFNDSFDKLLEQELGITTISKNGNFHLISGESSKFNEGINQLDTISVAAIFVNQQIIKLVKTDTLPNLGIVIEEWFLDKNEFRMTTTNINGELKGIYIESYIKGKKMGHYSDMTFDSLGQSQEEWGEINRQNR